MYQYWFGACVLVLVAFRTLTSSFRSKSTSSATSHPISPDFSRFQRAYVFVYLLAQASDWLQGPYVYALYRHYGFTIGEISSLFIMGFGSSLAFGLIVGSMADKYGRKKMSLVFCVLYGISCASKHFKSYHVLLTGRLLGGIATSILFSSFESWMVFQHHNLGFSEEWLGLTFSMCTSANGIVAVASGIVANSLVEWFGPVAPFDASLVLLVLLGSIIAVTWAENTGDARAALSSNIGAAWNHLRSDRKIALLGITQSLFEGPMYVFVFMWTPSLESSVTLEGSGALLSHGWIFATYMVCVLVGSSLFGVLLEAGVRVESIAAAIFGCAGLALTVPILTQSHNAMLICFCCFEVCCGMFWPTFGCLRSRYVPEEVRATVMNFFRVPLNSFVILVLFQISKMAHSTVWSICVACLFTALLTQMALLSMSKDPVLANRRKGSEASEQSGSSGSAGNDEPHQTHASPTVEKKRLAARRG